MADHREALVMSFKIDYTQINKANESMEKLRDSAKGLESNVNKIKVPGTITVDLDKMKNGTESAKHSASEMGDSYESASRKIKQNGAVISEAGHRAESSGSMWTRLKDKITGAGDATQKTDHTLRTFALGSAIGNGISNIASSAYSGFKNMLSEGMRLNTGLQAINASFTNMGYSRRQVRGLDSQISYLRKNTGMAGTDVATLQRSMTNWSVIGSKNAKRMTTSLAEVGAASRSTPEQMAKIGPALMRVGVTGKVTLSSLNRVMRTAPGLYTVLAKGAGMTRNQLRQTLATGKVTQAQFQGWLANASKFAPGIFKHYAHTQVGLEGRIRAGWQNLEADMTKPLVNVKTSGMQELASLMSSKAVTDGAKLLGQGLRQVAIWGMDILKFISTHRKDVVGIGTDLVKIAGTLAKDVWKDFTDIIFDLGKDFGIINKNAKPGSGLHNFRVSLDALAKNKGAIKTIAHSLVLIAGLTGLVKIAKAVQAIAGVKSTAYKTLWGTAEKDGTIKGGLMNTKFVKGLRGATTNADGTQIGAGPLSGALQSLRSAHGFGGLSIAGRVATIGTGLGVAASAGYDAIFKAFKDRHSAKKRSQDIGKGIGKGIGGGIGMWFGGPAGAAVGAYIGGKVGKWGGKAVYHFTKGWQRHKPPKNFWSLENLGWSTHNMFKGMNAGLRSTGRKIKSWAGNLGTNIHKGWDKGIKASHNFFKNMPKNLAAFGRSVNNNRYVKAFKHGQLFQTAFSDMEKRTRGFRRWYGATWSNLWKSVQNNRYVKAFEHGHFFATALHDISSRWRAFTKWFGKGWNNFWHGLSNTKDKVMNNVKAFSNDVAYAFGGSKHTFKYKKIKSHANGTASLVGEAGPELAYRPYANSARLLGANGPQLARIRSGERILNARDTRRVMSGGLGRGLVLRGYANGNTKLDRTTKSVTDDYKKISDTGSKSLKKLRQNSKQSWSQINNHTGKYSKQTRQTAEAEYKRMTRSVGKQMDNMHDGVISTAKSTSKGFGHAMHKSVGYAHDAMSDTMGQMNKGIHGIDKVLSQFGGNGSVIKPVHFATGTNGELTQNTLGILNDATTGPRQEAVVRGNRLIIPHGKDRLFPLHKHDQVLNGEQALSLAHAWGLSHFAKGSGVSHSQLRKIASRGLANPAKSFANMFTSNVKSKGPALQQGSVDLGKHSSTHYGDPWSTAMWTVINNAIGGASGKGGSREAFLKYAESTFAGVPYQMGAASKKLSDCSGMVMQALRHFGIDIGRTTVAMQHSSGVQYLGKSLSRTLPGDLVIFGHGTGAAGHVGIIKNPRTGSMFNETPPRARVTSIADDKGMGYGYYRVRGLHNAHQSKKTARVNKRLEALAKQELGHSALSWIKKHLSDDFGSLGSFSIGGDLKERARALAGGLKKLDPRATRAGIAAILGNWNFESGGLNPGAVNSGGGASGLGQWLGGRKTSLMAYARRHGKSWKNPAVQLEFAMRGDGANSAIFRRILQGHGSVSSLAAAFSREWERGGYDAQHVHGAMEIEKALGFAKGGLAKAHTPYIAGEHGPELITANGQTHIDTHEQTKHKVRSLADALSGKRVRARLNSQAHEPINININFNGPVGDSSSDMRKVANVAKREIARAMEELFDHAEGEDPSIY